MICLIQFSYDQFMHIFILYLVSEFLAKVIYLLKNTTIDILKIQDHLFCIAHIQDVKLYLHILLFLQEISLLLFKCVCLSLYPCIF